MSDVKKIIRLVSNENVYGCSPLALEAIERAEKDVHLYPDISPVKLKEKLAQKFGVGPKNIIIGAGSVRIIDGLIQMFSDESSEVLCFENTFSAYEQFARLHRRKCVIAPLTEWRCDPEQLLPLISDKTALIFIANPNNPTGTIITHNELESFLQTVPARIIVAVDEAYCEYVTHPAFPRSLELLKKYSNLVILRTFSKIYGLAGLRIGYGLMHEDLAERMWSGQIPFSLNSIATDAALAALEDDEFVQQSACVNAVQREYLFQALKKLGYYVLPSQANFVYLRFVNDEKKLEVYSKLMDNGIAICDLKVFGQDKALRITVGSEEMNRRIVEILSAAGG